MFNRVLKITGFALVLSLLFSGVTWSAKDSVWEETEGGIIVNMGVVPSNNPSIVCAKLHSEEEGVEDIRKETSHHLLFIFRDSTTGKFVDPEKVYVKVYAPSSDVIGSETLDNPLVGEYQRALDSAIREAANIDSKARLRRSLLLKEIAKDKVHPKEDSGDSRVVTKSDSLLH